MSFKSLRKFSLLVLNRLTLDVDIIDDVELIEDSIPLSNEIIHRIWYLSQYIFVEYLS